MALQSYSGPSPVRAPVLAIDPLDHVLSLMFLSLVSKFEYFELSEQLPRPSQCKIERGVAFDLRVFQDGQERHVEITFQPKAGEPVMDIWVNFVRAEDDELEAGRWSVPIRSMSIVHTAFTDIPKAIYSFMGTGSTGLKKVPTAAAAQMR